MTAAASRTPADLPQLIRHYIAGVHVESADGRTFANADPATNRPYCEVAAGGRRDVEAAVAAAGEAFAYGPWPRMSARERGRVLCRIAEGIEAREERLAELESFDTGLPITQARGQARRAAENFRYFADVINALHEAAFRTSAQVGYVIRKPVGVAGLITPWNTPFMLEGWKLAPALAAGCAVVLKPAEFTPLSASMWPRIMAEAGLPAGVFNMVHGLGESAGAALVEHPDVPLISFTGETATGRGIMRAAAEGLKGLSMELGGKSPCVVFADADLGAAVDGALFGVYSLNGERCTAGSRILVEESVYPEFVARFAERADRTRVGRPDDPATEIGALVHPEHYERVLGYVAAGRKQGARLVAGGERPAHLPDGNYLAATAFADVTPDMRIWREEIFGPVAAIASFRDEEDAVRLANDTPYGLAGYVWTTDLARGHRVAQAIDAGMVWLNSHNVRDLRTPFGGGKASGVGREGGESSIDFYTERQLVSVALGDTKVPRFGSADDD
ncbi:5-carboxymethyl-2-hydroxymuconate semialdehyde dehydrogenase [Streptomyces varsoviensis]|uniref:5-carboxymethyl-2-hydroxymuconate semialdehyde dehydrogenase n=1 Tax=Streptomyces varsoviensis TaxID=67373 RepID=UPI0034027A22